jgi:hypothetical protein
LALASSQKKPALHGDPGSVTIFPCIHLALASTSLPRKLALPLYYCQPTTGINTNIISLLNFFSSALLDTM